MTVPPRTDPPDELTSDQKEAVWSYVRTYHPHFDNDQVLGKLWVDCRDHYRAHGTQRPDWSAVFRQWINRETKYQRKNRHTQGQHAQYEGQQLPKQQADPTHKSGPTKAGKALLRVVRGITPDKETKP